MEKTPYSDNGVVIMRQPCEIYSRVVGFLRPIKQFNDSKQSEYLHRKNFKI